MVVSEDDFIICRSLTCWGFVLGLLSFISSRIWFTSFVPAWWDNGSNTVVIAVSAVATVDKIFSGENFIQFLIMLVTFIVELGWYTCSDSQLVNSHNDACCIFK